MISSMKQRLIVDASACIDGRPLVLEPVYFPTLVGAYARALRGAGRVIVVAPGHWHQQIGSALALEGILDLIELVEQAGEVGSTDICLDLCEIQHPSNLRRALSRTGKLPEPAWVVRTTDDIGRAASTLERHDMYLVARMIVLPVARPLANLLLPTGISPNSITALSAIAGVAGAGALVLPGRYWGLVAALLIHISITLDFTDGYLARLRGTDSRLGYWFDTLMDEVVKFALFLGLTVAVAIDGPPWAVPLGGAIMLLYHVLATNHWLTKSLESGDVTASALHPAPVRRAGWVGVMRRAHGRLNYLDVHLYIVAVGAILGWEVWVLALFGLDYSLRFARLIQVRLSTGQLA